MAARAVDPALAERLELSRPADLPSVEVLLAEQCVRRWRVFHETYTVCTVFAVDGPAEWTYRRQTYDADAGSLMLMEPGEVHANPRVNSGSFRALLIDPALMERAAHELGAPSPPHLSVAQLDAPALWRAFAGLHAALERPATALERQERFATCLRLLLEHCVEQRARPPTARQEPRPVRRALEFIHENIAAPIGLGDVAQVAGISQFHLVRAFATEVGLPPHAYQTQPRVARACALLRVGGRPADVALELGFTDQSHLTRHFSRIVGVTPGAYRRAMGPDSPSGPSPSPRLSWWQGTFPP